MELKLGLLFDQFRGAVRTSTLGTILSLVLAIGLPLGGSAVSLMLLNQYSEEEGKRLELLLDTTSLFIEREFEKRFTPIRVLQQMVDAGIDRDPELFRVAVAAVANAQVGYIAINRLNADRVIVAVYPEDRNRQALGRRVGLGPEVVDLLDLVERTGRPMATGPVALFQGGTGVASYFPLSSAGFHRGFLNAVIDSDIILQDAQKSLDPTMKVGLWETPIAQTSDIQGFMTLSKTISILGREAVVQVSLPGNRSHVMAAILQLALATLFFTITGILFFLANRSRTAEEQERQRLKDAIEALPFGFAISDASERLVAVNSGLRNMFPAMQDVLTRGTKIQDIVRIYAERAFGLQGASQEELVRREMERIRLGGTDETVRIGEQEWHRVLERRTSDGGLAQIRVDVSEMQTIRREAERRARLLAESEERYQRLIKSIGVITWTIARNAREFASLGGACDQILGYGHPDRVRFGYWLRQAHREDRRILLRLLRRDFDGHHEVDLQFRVKASDGRIVWLHAKGTELTTASGSIKSGLMFDVTAQKEATAAAELERLRLRDAIESLPASFLMFDRDERLVVANRLGFERFSPRKRLELGMTAGEIASIAANLGMLGTGQPEQELIDSRLTRFRLSSGSSEYHSPDGRWWQIIDRPTHEGGRIALRLDVTETKEAQAKLSELNRRFQAVLDNAPLAIFMKDQNDRYLLTNRRFDEWYLEVGRTAVGMTTAELRPPKRSAYLAQVSRSVLDTGMPIEREIDYVGPATGISHVLLTTFPIKNEDGVSVAIAGFVGDISDRKRSELLREATQNELRAVMDNTIEGLVTFDEGGTILTFNRRAEAIFGYGTGEVVGRNVSVLMVEPLSLGQDGYLSGYVMGALSSFIGAGREVIGVRKDGSKFPLEFAIGAIPSADGPRRFVGTLRDITARKELEQRLEHSQRIEALGRLTGGVAHDFNNVLAAIALNLEMLVPSVQDDPEARQWLDTATRAAYRGRSLTRQLLTIAGRQSLRPKRLKVRSILHEAKELLQTSLGSDHVLSVELTDMNLTVLADAGSLESALLNLVLNARDAEPEGGLIRISATGVVIGSATVGPAADLAHGHYVRIDVTDTGVGMSAELKAKAIEPFFTTKEIGKGSGLGLSMVFGFAKQSGGTAHIESEIRRGTTVSLYLPAAEPWVEQLAAPNATPSGALSSKHILLVEDEDMIRQSLSAQLTQAGFGVVSAASAEEAMALADQYPSFDLLVSDIAMPGGRTGIWLAQTLRQRRPDLPMILISGYVGDEEEQKELARLGIRVLNKPFRSRVLLEEIEKAFSGSVA